MDDNKVGNYRMYYVFAAFLKTFSSLFDNVKTLKAKIAQFTAEWQALLALVPDESVAAQDTKPITISKNQLFVQLRKKLKNMGKIAKGMALESNNSELQAAFSFKAKDLDGAEPQLIAIAKKLLEHFQKNATALLDYGLTADDITDLEKLIPLAEKNIGKPKTLKIQISTTNNKVNAAYDKVDALVKSIKNQLEGIYGEGMKAANPELIEKLTKSVKVDIVKHYTGIRFLFIDAETKEPIPKVAVDIPALKKKGLGGLNGKAEIIEMKTTESVATYTHKDYETKTANVKAVKGKIIDVVVELEKKK